MAEMRKAGAGSHLAGVLERAPQLRVESPVDPEPAAAEGSSKGRGAALVARPSRVPAVKALKKIKGRTIYLSDDLFERIIVQAHRRDLTISDYCGVLLDRHVPDHRRVGSASSGVSDPGDGEAS